MATPDEKLRAYYERAAARVIEAIGNAGDISSVRRQQAVLRQISSILDSLNSQAVEWIEQYLPEQYVSGTKFAIDEMVEQGLKVTETAIDIVIHQDAVKYLVEDTFDDLLSATQHMMRNVKQQIRQIGSQQLRTNFIAGTSRRNIAKELSDELLERGLSAITKSNGAKLRAEDYAQLVARTKLREAHSNGALNRYAENGQDLVEIPEHHPTCHICAPKQAKVYSISGKDDRFPALRLIGGGPPFHPN
jgi:hypothetical protein